MVTVSGVDCIFCASVTRKENTKTALLTNCVGAVKVGVAVLIALNTIDVPAVWVQL